MTVAQIISQVKWCIDHESRTDARLADLGEDTYMDNIIRARIPDALLWVTRMAASDARLGNVATATTTGGTLTVKPYSSAFDIGIITVPSSVAAASVSRVRADTWHKAATPTLDTADDVFMMYDDTAHATVDRPMAVVMLGNPVRVLIQPYTTGNVEVTYIGAPANVDTSSDSTDVTIPTMLRTAFLYYVAYLLLTAYADTRAQAMLAVAVQSLGANNTNQ